MPDIEICHTLAAVRLCCVQKQKNANQEMQKLTVRTMPFYMEYGKILN